MELPFVFRDHRRYVAQMWLAALTLVLGGVGAISTDGELTPALVFAVGASVAAGLLWRTAARRTVATVRSLEIHRLFTADRIPWDEIDHFDVPAPRSSAEVVSVVVVLRDGSSQPLAGTEAFGALVRRRPGDFPRQVADSANEVLLERRGQI